MFRNKILKLMIINVNETRGVQFFFKFKTKGLLSFLQTIELGYLYHLRI